MNPLQKIYGIFRMLVFIAAKKLGVTTTYHVAWRAPTRTGYIVGSGAYTMEPWLCSANYAQLVDFVSDEAAGHGATVKAVITSVTRIGGAR